MLRRALGLLVVSALGAVASVAQAEPSVPDARALYLLAHGHEDAGRSDEAQTAWRALVCHNRFPVSAPGVVRPKPQDDTVEHWREYRERFRDPRVLAKPTAETQYVEIYPDACEPATAADASMLPKYLAEAWWHIGNWELEGRDVAGGVVPDELESVWGLSRAASAFRHAARFPQSAVYPFALYKYATTLRRQQRYAAAVRAYTQLLDAPGEGQMAFREAALSGLAVALTYPDFEGPRSDAPYIPRPDVLDVESPAKAEKALRVAITRVQDAAIVPQDRAWTPAIYTRLGDTFARLGFYDALIDTFALVLAKFPLAKEAAAARLATAEFEWALTFTLREGTSQHRARSARALRAALSLVEVGGESAWAKANAGNAKVVDGAKSDAAARLRAMLRVELATAGTAKEDANAAKDKRAREEGLSDASAAYLAAIQCIHALLHVAPDASDASALRQVEEDARSEHQRIQGLLKRPAEVAR
jgi:tetratricopeptide (TPR) repeat protein